jgi:glycosyltransferase involved in cell wall biosynthesis
LRILTIAHSYPLHPGDATAPFMPSIVEGLAARGHSLDVLLPEHPRLRQVDSERIRFLRYRYSPVPGWAPWGYGGALTGASSLNPQAALALPLVLVSLRRRVAALLSHEPYDIVHAHWLVPNGWIASAQAARHGIPLVISLHGSDITVAERARPLHPAWRRALSRAGGLTAPSDDLRRRAERLGADPASSVTIHHGVDTQLFAPKQVGRHVRASLGAPDEGLLVVGVGRLVEKKGFRYLIEAASGLEGMHIAIVGEGDLRRELEADARRTGVPVTFTGALDQAAVADVVAAADVFAVPSVVDSHGNVDGLPTTLLEALAAGRAVVASAVAGIPEVVTNRQNGLLIGENDAAALAQALTELRDRPELRDQLGSEARARALRELSREAAAERFEHALLAAVSRG